MQPFDQELRRRVMTCTERLLGVKDQFELTRMMRRFLPTWPDDHSPDPDRLDQTRPLRIPILIGQVIDRDGAIRFGMAKMCQRSSKALPGVWSAAVVGPIEVYAVWFLPRPCDSRVIKDSEKLTGIERGLDIDLNPVTGERRARIAGSGMICLGG